MLVLGVMFKVGLCQALGFLKSPSCSCTLSLESLWWHLTPTKRTALNKAEFWTLALEYEF